MAQFLGDIAFLLEMVLVAGGLVLLLAGAGTALCTSYFWFRYHGQGDFDRAHPMPMGSMMPGGMHEPGAGGMMHHPAGAPPSDR